MSEISKELLEAHARAARNQGVIRDMEAFARLQMEERRRMERERRISIWAIAISCASILISLTSIIGSCRRYPRHHDIIHPVASADLKTKPAT